jgi:hypothetical protein
MTTKQLAGTMVHELFESHIYLICDRTFECVLCTHKADKRSSLGSFVKTLQRLYKDAVAFPL